MFIPTSSRNKFCKSTFHLFKSEPDNSVSSAQLGNVAINRTNSTKSMITDERNTCFLLNFWIREKISKFQQITHNSINHWYDMLGASSLIRIFNRVIARMYRSIHNTFQAFVSSILHHHSKRHTINDKAAHNRL